MLEQGWIAYEGTEPISDLAIEGDEIVVRPRGQSIEEKSHSLWASYKRYQQKYVDGEDLTLASLMMLQGNLKGKSLTFWVQKLWLNYYHQKALLLAGQPYSADPAINVPPPDYTIAQLNQDVLRLFADEILPPVEPPTEGIM